MVVRPGPSIEPHLLGIESLLPTQVARRAPRSGVEALLTRCLVDALGDAGLLCSGRWRRRWNPRRCALAVAWLTGTIDDQVVLPVTIVCDALGIDAAHALAATVRRRVTP